MANILCIEDEVTFRNNLKEILENEGYKVQAFGDGSDALEYLRALDHDPPEIIICDINLPQISGFEFIRRLKVHESAIAHIPVLFLSAMGQKQDVMKGMSLEAVDYLVKPVDFDILLSKIRTFVNSNRN